MKFLKWFATLASLSLVLCLAYVPAYMRAPVWRPLVLSFFPTITLWIWDGFRTRKKRIDIPDKKLVTACTAFGAAAGAIAAMPGVGWLTANYVGAFLILPSIVSSAGRYLSSDGFVEPEHIDAALAWSVCSNAVTGGLFGAIVGAIRLRWRSRRFGPHQCIHCGYDLTGNVSGRCPECGTAVEGEEG